MSVPPEIDARCTDEDTHVRTKSNPSGPSGEPVDAMVLSLVRSCRSAGRIPDLRTVSMNLADSPRNVSCSDSAIANSRSRPG